MNDSDDQIRLNKLTLGTMPSAMPSSLSYYQEKGKRHDEDWNDLESQTSLSIPVKTFDVRAN